MKIILNDYCVLNYINKRLLCGSVIVLYERFQLTVPLTWNWQSTNLNISRVYIQMNIFFLILKKKNLVKIYIIIDFFSSQEFHWLHDCLIFSVVPAVKGWHKRNVFVCPDFVRRNDVLHNLLIYEWHTVMFSGRLKRDIFTSFIMYTLIEHVFLKICYSLLLN